MYDGGIAQDKFGRIVLVEGGLLRLQDFGFKDRHVVDIDVGYRIVRPVRGDAGCDSVSKQCL